MNLTYRLDQIAQVVTDMLLPAQDAYSIFTLTGPLGAGKTTRLKQWLAANDVEQVVISPTFTYVCVYTNPAGQTFYHFDLYRLASLAEFEAMGFVEYLQMPNSFVFIEWPGILESLLCKPGYKNRVCALELEYDLDDFNRRIIKLQAVEKVK